MRRLVRQRTGRFWGGSPPPLNVPGGEPNDVSTALSSAGAWASGAIGSTPRDMNAFIRDDLDRKFFGDGGRTVTTTVDIPAPDGRLLAGLRSVQTAAVCAELGK